MRLSIYSIQSQADRSAASCKALAGLTRRAKKATALPGQTALLVLSVLMVAPASAYDRLKDSAVYSTPTDKIASEVQIKSAWFTQNGLHPNTDTLLTALTNAEMHGLSPDLYRAEILEQAVNSFVTKSEKFGKYFVPETKQERITLEKHLDKSFALYATHVGRGVLDAQKTQRSLFRPAPEVDVHGLLNQLQENRLTVREALASLTPKEPAYKKLQAQLKILLDERDAGGERTQVRYNENVKPGGEFAQIAAVRKRLQETGDLPADSRLSLLFDSEVENALKSVQKRNGLDQNGELTDSTVIALNASVDEDIEQVAMNLERWRWMPREMGERHILVNIPAYNLTMRNGDQKIVDMGVVVGSKRHQTPAFSKGAQFVEVAPTWTVPASITNNELIPLELRKPGYLKSEKIDFFRWNDGKLIPVPRSQVTQADFHKKPFPYVLRQRAGEDNVLGRVKILMPNKYAIYMHDTQAKSLFAKTDRAFSHGCIRLSDPQRMASLLLQLDGKTQEESKEILDLEETTRVRLKTKTPTHISYFTAWVDDDGKLNKRKDVYKHNQPLLDGLYKRNTLLTTLKSRSNNILAEQEEL